jgi:hypothetical protein
MSGARRRSFLAACALPAVQQFAALAAVAQGPGYQVIDLMPDYWAFKEKAKDLDDDAQAALFLQTVVRAHPEVYTSRVIGLAQDKPFAVQLAARYKRVERLIAPRQGLMRELSQSIARDLPRYEAKFRETFPDLDYRGEIYFLYSAGAFDGATREVKGRTALLFGVDMIAFIYGTDADPQPFFHHELFHLYHTQFAGAGRGFKPSILAALWREGLATYVAQTLNPQAIGVAVFGLPRSTPTLAQGRLSELARELRGLLDSASQEDYQRFFTGAREDAPVPARSGYYVGFLVAKELAKKHALLELAHAPIDQVRPEIEAALDAMAAGVR